MAEVNKPTNNKPEVAKTPPPTTVEESEKAMKLVAEMLAEKTTDIRPQLDTLANWALSIQPLKRY